MSQLRIYLKHDWQDAFSICDWALLDAAGAITKTGGDALASMPVADECVAVVGASQVLCLAKNLPKIKASQLEAALPLAVEESMLGDAGDQHVVPGAPTSEGATVLYAIDKTRLRRFVEACAAASIRLRKVVPEYCLLNVDADQWSVAWDGESGFLAMPFGQGLSLGHGDTNQAPAAFSLQWQATSPAPSKVRVFTAAETMPQWQGISLVRADEPFDWRTARLTSYTPNLLWGKFKPPIRLQEWWPKVRPLFWIIVMALCIEAVGYNLQWWSLAHEKQTLKHSMNAVFQETFGSEVEVMDASLQMQRSLARARHAAGVTDDADFLPLLERVSAELSAQAGGRVKGLRYAEGQLDIDVRLSGRAGVESLERRLGEQGLSVQVLEVNESGEGVEAHLRISTGGAR
ncbi:MAG: proteinral secretion pathway protein L [Gallionellaceae bacterium]|nr:MAG: proteinral secretion pathway protein L [Gallionellaceae bacterium]